MNASRFLMKSALFAVTLGALVTVTMSPASADTSHRYRNNATLLCLDSNSSGSVYTLGCNGGNFQNWHRHFGTFAYRFINNQTNRCLDSNASRSVYTQPCNGGSYQEWQVAATDRGYELRNVATGFCLDSNTGGGVYTLGCNGGNFQRWIS